MRLSLKTRFTLATSLLVFAVVAVVSGLYIGRLTRQTLRQAAQSADFVAHQDGPRLRSMPKTKRTERGQTAAHGPSRVAGLPSESVRQQHYAKFA